MARAIVESSSSVVNDVATGEVWKEWKQVAHHIMALAPYGHLFKPPTVKNMEMSYDILKKWTQSLQ
jgi:hypothetical protein